MRPVAQAAPEAKSRSRSAHDPDHLPDGTKGTLAGRRAILRTFCSAFRRVSSRAALRYSGRRPGPGVRSLKCSYVCSASLAELGRPHTCFSGFNAKGR